MTINMPFTRTFGTRLFKVAHSRRHILAFLARNRLILTLSFPHQPNGSQIRVQHLSHGTKSLNPCFDRSSGHPLRNIFLDLPIQLCDLQPFYNTFNIFPSRASPVASSHQDVSPSHRRAPHPIRSSRTVEESPQR